MRPVTTPISSFTCESCGAPLNSLTKPCPYCGHVPAHAVAGAAAAPSDDADSGALPLEVAILTTAGEPGTRSPLPLPAGTLARGVRNDCIAGVAAALVGALVISIVIWGIVSSIANQAGSAAISLVQDDPTAVAADHLAPLDGYMKAGERKDAAAADALFMHGFGVTVPGESDLASEFAGHPERYRGYQSVRETGFVRVHVYGGNGDYWELRAVATYTDGPARVTYADMIQHDGWKLYEVDFPDVPVP